MHTEIKIVSKACSLLPFFTHLNPVVCEAPCQTLSCTDGLRTGLILPRPSKHKAQHPVIPVQSVRRAGTPKGDMGLDFSAQCLTSHCAG